MKLPAFLVALIATITLAGAGGTAPPPTEPPLPDSCDSLPAFNHINKFHRIVNNAYAPKRWEDATPATKLQKRRWSKERRCVTDFNRRDRMNRYLDKQRHEFRELRQSKLRKQRRAEERRALAPYKCGSHGRFAIPCYVVECESGYDWGAVNPSSGAFTAYQFLPSTYRGACRECNYRRTDFHYAAGVVWARSGGSEWVCA